MTAHPFAADEFPAQFDDLRQIQVIPLYLAIIHARKACVETAPNMDNDRLRVAGHKVPRVAVENGLGHAKEFTAPIPAAVYTFPEIAAVGMTQEQAREKNIPVAIGSFPMGYLGKSMAVGWTEGFAKVIRHRQSGALLGVHLMGHNVTEAIHAAVALLHQRVSLAEMAEVVMAHPTISEALHEAAEDALGMALHLPPRKVVRIKA